MFSKNHIITGVVIVAVIGGGIFFISRNSSSSDASSLEHGTKNLTRESAAKMIETKIIERLLTAVPEAKELVRELAVSVEVTGISEPAQGDGGNTRKASFTYKYNDKGEVKEAPGTGTATFMLYDDGWRIDVWGGVNIVGPIEILAL